MDAAKRAIWAQLLRQLASAARFERRQLDLDEPRRHFYLGVEAAANGLLHPKAVAHRKPDWLDHERREFRKGYLTMIADLTVAMSVATPPAAIPLPKCEDEVAPVNQQRRRRPPSQRVRVRQQPDRPLSSSSDG